MVSFIGICIAKFNISVKHKDEDPGGPVQLSKKYKISKTNYARAK
jgi:hypothetical protein